MNTLAKAYVDNMLSRPVIEDRFRNNLERLTCRILIDAIHYEAGQGEIAALPNLLRELRELTVSASAYHPPCDKCHRAYQTPLEAQQQPHHGQDLLQSLDQTLSELLLEIEQDSQTSAAAIGIAECPGFITIEDAAHIAGISKSRIEDALHAQNPLPHWPEGSRYYIVRDLVMPYFIKNKVVGLDEKGELL